MAPELSQHGGGDKDDFKKRFEGSYKNWLDGKTAKESSETPKPNLCPEISKKKDNNDPPEDPRVGTDSTLPKIPKIEGSDNEIMSSVEGLDKKIKSSSVEGFDNEIKSLKNFLLDQKVYKEFKTLVVAGEYGVGKTALCKEIFNDAEVKSVYAPRVWVSMYSKEAKVGEDTKISVLKRILISLGVKDTFLASIHDACCLISETGHGDQISEEISALLYALNLNLRWKKYLIVFDDVRDEDNWKEMLQVVKKGEGWGKYLSDGFPKGSGGRVIYTTRDDVLAKKLVPKEYEIHRLWPLTDSESVWNIYEAELKKNGVEAPRNDKKCIDELMNKSRGLPLAIKLMATLLPVLLDDENPEDESSHETNDSVNNPTPNSPPQP